MRLITIRFSHYCEKARWAMDAFEVPYEEEGHLPLFHIPAVRRVHSKGSPDRASSSSSTPVLISDDGSIFDDSSRIVRYISNTFGNGSLYPSDEVAALEQRFHDSLAIHSRRFVYGDVLSDAKLFRRIAKMNVDGWEARSADIGAKLLMLALRKALDVNPGSVLRSLTKIDDEMEFVSQQMEESGTSFLCGESLSAADIAFACAAAPALNVSTAEGYGAQLPDLDSMPEAFQAHATRWRNTTAGQHALKLFKEHRGKRALPYGHTLVSDPKT